MTTNTNEDRDVIVNEELSDQELDGVVGGSFANSLPNMSEGMPDTFTVTSGSVIDLPDLAEDEGDAESVHVELAFL